MEDIALPNVSKRISLTKERLQRWNPGREDQEIRAKFGDELGGSICLKERFA